MDLGFYIQLNFVFGHVIVDLCFCFRSGQGCVQGRKICQEVREQLTWENYYGSQSQLRS